MLSLPRRTATGWFVVSMMGATACAAANAGEQSPAIPDGRSETTVYLIRHGEKASDTEENPDLSQRGRARAESLAVQLRDSGVNVIITSDLKRTIQTAAPLAKARHIRPKVFAIGSSVDNHVKQIADEVMKHPGATVLIVGHNNTVGKIVQKLGGGNIGDICTDEYSNLIIMSIAKGRAPQILLESYGVPDPEQMGTVRCTRLKDR
jgi:phosphohistidine phosphatase SixA